MIPRKLDKRTRKHVEANWRSVSPKNRSERRAALRHQSVTELLDLALYAEREPEDQLAQVFTPTAVRPLIRALIGEGCEEITSRHYEIAKVMLDFATKRLQQLIQEDYRQFVIPSLNNLTTLLTFLPSTPPTPKDPSSETLQSQRSASRRERASIWRDYYAGRPSQPNEATNGRP